MAARIAPDGRIVDPPHVIVPGAFLISDRHTIASNGNVTVVLTSGGYSVLDKDLRVIDSGARSSNVAPNASGVFTNGSGGFILTGNGGLRLDGTGHPMANGLQPSSIGGVIACHGNECLQVFDLGYASNLNATSYDPATGSHTPAVGLSISSGDGYYDVVATADGYLLFSGTGLVQRFDGQHNPLGPPASLSWPGSAGVVAASNGHNTVVLRSTNPVSIALVTPSSAGDLRNVATSGNAQRYPAITTDGSNYLVAWEENDGIYAGRLSLDGTALDGRGRRITTATGAPAVAYDGASYFVSVGDGSQTTMVRIDPSNGATLATRTICGDGMHIAGNGTTHIAVWDNCGGTAVAFIDANGVPASTPVSPPPALTWRPQVHPAVAWNGTEWLMTWEEEIDTCGGISPPNCPPAMVTIRGVRLSAALTPIDTTPMTISDRSVPGSSRLASDGHDFLAVWSSDSVHDRRISASGEVFEDQALFAGTAQDIIWDGVQYDLAFVTSRPDLAVAHLRPSGQAFETFLISATTDDKRSPSLVSLGNGRVVAAYTRLGHESLYGGVPRALVTTPRPARGRAAR